MSSRVGSLSFRLSRLLWRLVGVLFFNRIDVLGRDKLPRHGPVLYVALHRNGVMDGLAYTKAVPRALPMVSAQWHRCRIGRFFFPGIAVARDKDRKRGIEVRAEPAPSETTVPDHNAVALSSCVDHLAQGGELFVCPEGTSALGPQPLPFKSGAARIAQAASQLGVPLKIVALGIFYERAWEWQSRVQVVVGDTHVPSRGESLDALQTRIRALLYAVAERFDSPLAQEQGEALAYAATLGTGLNYADVLLTIQSEVSDSLMEKMAALHQLAKDKRGFFHQGVPLVPIGAAWAYWLLWLLTAPVYTAGAMVNFPVIAAAVYAPRKFADESNVIALWRLLGAFPAALAWWVCIAAASVLLDSLLLPAAYAALSVFWIRYHYRMKKLSVACANSVRLAEARPRMLALHQALLEEIRHAPRQAA